MKNIIVFFCLLFSCVNDGSLSRICPYECYTGPDSTRSVGACHSGKSICNDALVVTECKDQVLPSSEVCNGADDDCDGKTDEYTTPEFYDPGYPCLVFGECAKSAAECKGGKLICKYPDTVELPNETRCDNLDNNCDGRIDEDLFTGQYCYEGPVGTEANYPCHPGLLKCEAGSIICANQYLPRNEICDNGIDEDCSGIADDGLWGSSDQYDIVFTVDTSGSMCGEISAVAGASNAYAQQFDNNSKFRFALVIMSTWRPPPYVTVDTNFTDFSNIRNRLLTLGCNGSAAEASLDSMHNICDANNPLNLSWRLGANRLSFIFTDELAQTYSTPATTGQMIVDSCLETSTLLFVWSETSIAFQPIAEATNGVRFELTDDWQQIFNDMNSIVVSFCSSGG